MTALVRALFVPIIQAIFSILTPRQRAIAIGALLGAALVLGNAQDAVKAVLSALGN